MSKKEVGRREGIQRIIDGVIRQVAGAKQLGLSDRQVRRLCRSYEAEGARALVRKKRGRASNRRLDDGLKASVLEALRTRYQGFGPTLATEYLKHDGHAVSKETVRQWISEAGLWRIAAGRRSALQPPRQRRPRLGEWVQMDGSPTTGWKGGGRAAP